MADAVTDLYDDPDGATPAPIHAAGDPAPSAETAATDVAPDSASVETPSEPARERGPDGRFIKPPHPEYLTRKAADYGISSEEAAALSTAELREMMRDMQSERANQQLLIALHQGLNPASPSAAGEVPPASPAAPSTDLKFDPEAFVPEFRPFLEAVQQQAKEIAALKNEVTHLRQHSAAQADETAAQRIDRAFDSMAKDRYGTGRPDLQSGEMARRRATFAEAQRLTGKPKPSVEEVCGKLTLADKNLFGGAPASTPNAEPPISPERWNAGGVARPTQRAGSKDPLGKPRAEAAVADYLRMHNASPNGDAEVSGNAQDGDFLE